jgi:hypothetical protein
VFAVPTQSLTRHAGRGGAVTEDPSQQDHQQHSADDEGKQDRSQATEAVGEEEEHFLTVPGSEGSNPEGRFLSMCRSIKTLRGQLEVTDEEVAAAALQFVRKVSGYRQPSKANQAAFDSAVEEVAASTARLLQAVGSPPHAATDRIG